MKQLYEYIDVTHNTRFMVISLFLAILFFSCFFTYCLRTSNSVPAQEVHVSEDILTLQMNPSVLMKALKENAADWCQVKRSVPLFGDIIISSTEAGNVKFKEVFLTDSVAPLMAREYPHLFQYEEDGDHRSFTMSANRTSVTVPVWLVKTLIEKNVLLLP